VIKLKKIFIFSLLLSIIILVSSCGCNIGNMHSQNTEESTTIAETLYQIIPKSADELIVFLHAGGSDNGMTHLNAQETFLEYYSQGYRYFEYDLKLSSDGRIIATHEWEYLNVEDQDNITYDEFKSLRLENGYTPANEEWIMDTIRLYPDVRFIIDAKMDTDEGDAAVLIRLEELERIYEMDISENIIPEVFSKEMWEIVKESTSFDRYLFSHYKVYYTVDMMLEYFSDPGIWGISLPLYTDSDIRSQIYRLKENKQIFVFTPQNPGEIVDAALMGADGVYLDFTSYINK
jgi:glycerophosphoryl diester phosphodiesterase